MKWHALGLTGKIVIGTAILGAALIAPELALLLQFGGIETAFAYSLLWVAPLLAKTRVVSRQVSSVIAHLSTVAGALWHSLPYRAISRPDVFSAQSLCCLVAWGLTGSVSLALLCYMPGLLVVQNLM
ncbi:hypothetical protein IT774_09720 [Salinimonas marina]|uniref:Uncharacterized protein n=1 Tax=Salinimonas marina TaxID=2785918 RepID=A0A7S9HBS3_9ALTE|nr:hypothetical protein [Salinimonas marina]QPG04521.1 hypothetical protein IT774_09720 [Salinimonas marina]